MRLLEEDNHWTLKLIDGRVARIQIDFRLGIDLSDSEVKDVATLYIETEFSVKNDDSIVQINPENTATLSPILKFFNKEVEQIRIAKTGQLVLYFRDGQSIEVPPNKRYEAWQLGVPPNILLVCSPGGSISVFQQSSERRPETVQ